MPAEDLVGSMGMSEIVTSTKPEQTPESGVLDDDSMFIIKQKHLEAVLGIHEGTPVANELAAMEDTLVIARAIVGSLDSSALSSEDSVISTVEEILHQLISDFQQPESSSNMELDIEHLGKVFKIDYLDTVTSDKAFVILKYFIGCMRRLQGSDSSVTPDLPLKRFVDHMETAMLSFFIPILRGFTSNDLSARPVRYSFARMLMLDQFPLDILYKIINFAMNKQYSDADCLGDIFNPLFDIIRFCVTCTSLTEPDDLMMEKPFVLTKNLLTYKVENIRPLTDLVCSRPDFCPKPYTGHRGRELSKMTFLGAFLNLGVCDFESDSYFFAGSERYFPTGTHIPMDDSRFQMYDSFQHRINSYRRYMLDIVHTCLVNAPTREKTLNFLSSILKANKKRSQIQADATKLATDSFMLNFMYIMLNLAEKVTLEKVDPNYIFHPKCRVDVKDETRLKYNSEEVVEFEKTLDLNADPKFPTECFFMTIHSVELGFNACMEEWKRIKRHISQVNSTIRELEQQIKSAVSQKRNAMRLTEKLKIQKATHDKLAKTLMCFECSLRDRALLDRTFLFTNKQLNFLISMINPNYCFDYQVPDEAPRMFGMYPEMYLEAVLEFVVAIMQFMPNLLIEIRTDLPQQLLLFLCSTQFLNNPFLAAKIIDVVFAICPEMNPGLSGLHESLVNTPLAVNKLVPSMIKFYADIENGIEFYERFSIRRNMQVIFRSLWKMPIYRSKIIEIARECKEEFVRFINMVINDATYLLDESLANLKKIHDVEAKMGNEIEWNSMTDEARQAQHGTLSEATRSVRSWLIMGDDTMDMFCYLTKDVPEPFYLDPLGDRVASMLNHNLLELCGPKCTELKVKDADSRFHWNPRRLLNQIVDVYINLSSDEFAQCIAGDERSYTPEKFEVILKKINDVLSISSAERFSLLSSKSEMKYREKMQMEDDFGDDIPDEFRDPILANIMLDPVKLPSGHIMDRKNILRHLLTTPMDPFSRLPCKPEDLVPVPELKAQIDDWCKERRKQAREQKSDK